MAFQGNAFQNDQSEGLLGEGLLGEIVLGSDNAAFQVEEESTFTGAHGQSQAWIEQTYNAHAQAQGQIKQTYYTHGQAQALIGNIYYAHGQAQASIKAIGYGFGQSQAQIKQTYNQHGQCQATILSAFTGGHGQAQATITAQYYQLLDDFSNRTFGPLSGSTPTSISLDAVNYPPIGQYSQAQLFDEFEVLNNRLESVLPFGAGASYFYTIVTSSDITTYIDFFADAYDNDTYAEIFYSRLGFTNFVTAYFYSLDNTLNFDFEDDSVSISFGPLEDGEAYRFMLHMANGNYRLKLWKLSEPEPSTWSFEVAHSTFTADRISLGVNWDSAANFVWIDNLTVLIPQVPIAQRYGQARAFMLGVTSKHGQARARINATLNRHGQARAFIRKSAGYGQARARIQLLRNAHGQAQASILSPWKFGQAQATIHRPEGYGNSAAIILTQNTHSAQARAFIRQAWASHGQAQAWIISSNSNFVGQAQAYIYRPQGYGQARAVIAAKYALGQAQGQIKTVYKAYGQAGSYIYSISIRIHGQAQAQINGRPRVHGQAQAYIAKNQVYGQAQGYITGSVLRGSGQALATINNRHYGHGLTRAYIIKPQAYGQARARIAGYGWKLGNAQAFIRRTDARQAHGQAQAMLRMPATGQAQALISGAKYLVRFNGYDLPGYAQQEAIDTPMKFMEHEAVYEDGSMSEYIGLQNKRLSLDMRVVGPTYADVKKQARDAGTYVRTGKGFVKFYLQNYDRYYLAQTVNIKFEKAVGTSMKILDYNVEFETKPWLISDAVYVASGTGTLTIDRPLADGGWTYAAITVDGADVTVSGYSGETFAGYFAASGTVTGLVIDSETYTATLNGENANGIMNPDYAIYVAPGATTYEISGATRVEIRYQNRWYL